MIFRKRCHFYRPVNDCQVNNLTCLFCFDYVKDMPGIEIGHVVTIRENKRTRFISVLSLVVSISAFAAALVNLYFSQVAQK